MMNWNDAIQELYQTHWKPVESPFDEVEKSSLCQKELRILELEEKIIELQNELLSLQTMKSYVAN